MAPERLSAWSVAMLCAGLLLNATLFESLSPYYDLLARPWWPMLLIGLWALFLCAAVVYLPLKLARSSGCTFEQMLDSCLGVRPAWFFRKVLVPVWAAAWFTWIGWDAIHFVGLAMNFAPSPRWGRGTARTLAIVAFWVIMIAPSARVSLAVLARWSVFLAKVSFAAVLGLGLSVATLLPDAMERIAGYEIEPSMVFMVEPCLLLWATPPLLLCVSLIRSHSANRRATGTILVAGIALPFVFGAAAALLTSAGGTMLGALHRKHPSYLEYAFARPEKFGWVKILVLAFTLLTATRFAANLCVGLLPGTRSWVKAIGVTTLLLAASLFSREVEWGYRAWQVAAIPFAPLAGVLGGTYLASPIVRHRPRPFWSLVAWIAGCVVTSIPSLAAQYPGYSGIWPAWVVAGWFVSFGGAYLAQSYLKRHAWDSRTNEASSLSESRSMPPDRR